MIIGRTITVTDAKNTSLVGKRGIVIDETAHTITITNTHNRRITLIKEHIITIEETP